MPTTAEIIAVLRQKNPKFKDYLDTEIEAEVGSADPRYRELFDRARGALGGSSTTEAATMLPPSVEGTKRDPRQYDDNSITERVKETAYTSLPDPNEMVEALPTAGAIGGGIVGTGFGGPVGAVGAAGLGSAGGEKLRQMIQRARGKETLAPEEADWQMKKQTLLGAGSEVGGQATAKGFELAAPYVYRAAAHLPPSLVREFPTIVQDALKAGVPITAKGAAKATGNVASGAAEADALIAAAEKAGAAPLDVVKDVIKPTLGDVGPMARNQAALGRPSGTSDLAQRTRSIRDFFRARKPPPVPVAEPVRELTPGYQALLEQQQQLGHMSNLLPSRLFEPTSHEVKTGLELGHRAMLVPRRLISGEPVVEKAAEQAAPKLFNDIPLTQAQALKREAQDLSDAAYRAQERGGVVNSVDRATDEALAKSLRAGIENRVPEVIPVNEATQRAIGVNRMVEGTRERGANLGANIFSAGSLAGVLPTAAAGHPVYAASMLAAGLGTKALTSPAVLSHAAIGLDRASSPLLHTSAYRAMIEAIRKQLEDDAQQQNPPNQ